MSLPIREQILQAIAARVTGTRILEQFDARDLPVTVVADDEESNEPAYDMEMLAMPVTIARAIPLTGAKTDAWHTTANVALADLLVELYTGGDTLGGLAHGIDYTGGSVEILSDGALGAIVQVVVSVRYSIVRGNPYSNEEET